jgi:hypothetical protein
MARTITTESPSRDARRYLRHWANADFVEPRLRVKHPGLTADRRRTKARQIAVLLEQGIEFVESAENSSALTKPLALYYSTENLARAACIFRDATKDVSNFGHHGLSGDRKKRNFVRNLSCTVSGGRNGVWPQFFALFNSDWMRFSVTENGSSLRRDSRVPYATKQLTKGKELNLGELLRHLPELAEDVVLADWGHPLVVHAMSLEFTTHSGPPTQYSARIVLRHGHHPETRAMVIDRESDCSRATTEHLTRRTACSTSTRLQRKPSRIQVGALMPSASSTWTSLGAPKSSSNLSSTSPPCSSFPMWSATKRTSGCDYSRTTQRRRSSSTASSTSSSASSRT